TQIPVQHGFRGARVTAPQKRVHIPVKQTIPLPVVELALLLRQISRQQRKRVTAAEDSIMVEPEPGRNQVQQVVNRLFRLVEPGANGSGVDAAQRLEHSFPCDDGVDHAQEPFQLEVEAGPAPLEESLLHLFTSLRPTGADFGQGQVALRQLRSAAVDLVENIHDHVQRLILASYPFNVQVDVLNPGQPVQSVEIHGQSGAQVRVLVDACDEPADALLHQLSDVDP